MTKEAEQRLDVMEMKMLRIAAGLTRLDRVCNMDVRGKFGVIPVSFKMRESRLRRHGHVLRGDENTVWKVGLGFEVAGKRPRGRPKQGWLDTLHVDLRVASFHPDWAQHRSVWRQRTSAADPAAQWDKR